MGLFSRKIESEITLVIIFLTSFIFFFLLLKTRRNIKKVTFSWVLEEESDKEKYYELGVQMSHALEFGRV